MGQHLAHFSLPHGRARDPVQKGRGASESGGEAREGERRTRRGARGEGEIKVSMVPRSRGDRKVTNKESHGQFAGCISPSIEPH